MSRNIFDYEVTYNGIKELVIDNFKDYLTLEMIEDVSNVSYDMLKKDMSFIDSLDPSQNSIEMVQKTKTKSLIATMCYRVANTLYYKGYLKEKTDIIP
ncbi:MAG: hypothetical protein MR288_00410, partial [Firmicutes bacterium]|nr:hypothetical protein [Bacillota bacterium]